PSRHRKCLRVLWASGPRNPGEAFQHLLVRPAEFRPDVMIPFQSEDLIDQTVAVLGLERATDEKARSGHKFPTPPDRQAPFTFSSRIGVRQFVVFERGWRRLGHG